nr:PAS domain S-box protein [Lutibacter sp.]
ENEVVGKNWFDHFVPKQQAPRIKELINSVHTNGVQQVKRSENLIVTKSGEERLIAWTNVSTYNEVGEISSTLSSGEDITEKKKTETLLKINEHKYRTLFEYAPEGILIANTEGFYIDANTTICTLLGYTLHELVGLNATSIVAPMENEHINPALATINSNKQYEREWLFKRKDNSTFSAEVTATTLPDGTILAIVKDITERKKLEASLLNETNRLQAIIDNIPVMITLYDPAIKVLYLNKEFETKSGVTTKESAEIDMMALVYPDPKIRKKTEDFMKAAPKKWLEIPFTTKNGTVLTTEWTNIKLENGTQIGIGLDITERKNSKRKLIEFNNRLQIIHSIDVALLNATDSTAITKNVLDKLKAIVPFSHASVTEYDKNSDSFRYIHINTIIPNLNMPTGFIPSAHVDFLDKNSVSKGQTQILENISNCPIESKLGKKALAAGLNSFMMFPLISENVIVGTFDIMSESMAIFTDINVEIIQEIGTQLALIIHQHNLKQEILTYTEALEEKIAERTAQLEFSNSELRDFAQVVSHDLKAPLRAISQLSYWIANDYSDKIDEAGQEQLSMLLNRVKRMDNLIEGILQYSRAGRAREKEIPMNLQLIVKEVINSINPPTFINIKIENELPEIVGDPTRFGQVFQNLISNAIKFNDKPTGIIKIGCVQKENYWEFYVADNGPGIEEKYFDRIFQIFQRLESRDNLEGTGIGLTLVKRIIQLYNGEIWITSTINKGTTFHFTIPIKH